MEIFATPKYNCTMETVGNPSAMNKKSSQTPSVMNKKSEEVEDVIIAYTSESEKKHNKKGNNNVEDVDLDVQVGKKKHRKHVKVPGAPTKTPPVFLKWSIEERMKINKQMGNLSFAEMGKELANRWEELNPEEKQPVSVYEEAVQYLLKKVDYDEASSSYCGTLPSGSAKIKGRRNQDPGAPKKPAPMFLKWSMEERSVIKEELGPLKPVDMSKELGRRWEVLNQDVKQLYADRYKQEKEEYNVARGRYLVESVGKKADYNKASYSHTETLPPTGKAELGNYTSHLDTPEKTALKNYNKYYDPIQLGPRKRRCDDSVDSFSRSSSRGSSPIPSSSRESSPIPSSSRESSPIPLQPKINLNSAKGLDEIKVVKSIKKEKNYEDTDNAENINRKEQRMELVEKVGVGLFKCRECHYTSKFVFNVEKHVEGHLSTDYYKCHLCPSTFGKEVNFKFHMKVKHSIKE